VNVKTGPDGKFRANGLVPGLTYWATLDGAHAIHQAVLIDPGKVKELADATE
jgi:hypothetical protein